MRESGVFILTLQYMTTVKEGGTWTGNSSPLSAGPANQDTLKFSAHAAHYLLSQTMKIGIMCMVFLRARPTHSKRFVFYIMFEWLDD